MAARTPPTTPHPSRLCVALAAIGLGLVLAGPAAALAVPASHVPDPELDLLPWPAKVERMPGALTIPSPLQVEIDANAPDLIANVRALLLRWESSTGIRLIPPPSREWSSTPQSPTRQAPTRQAPTRQAPTRQAPSPQAPSSLAPSPWLRVSITASGSETDASPRDESYQLTTRDDGVLIEAPTVQGARWGLATLEQLLDLGPNGFSVPIVRIDDTPRYEWRGLLLDSCRHWLPKDLVLRTLEAMAAVKMNVLHWHLTEDQAFRIESKRYPRLHEVGSGGSYYTQDDVREVIETATSLGIRVVPEFDVPGHTTSWLVAYPDALSPFDGPQGRWRLADTFDVQRAALDPTRDSTYELLSGFFAEMADLFPDPVIHIGGDEVNGAVWEASPRVRRFMAEQGISTTQELQDLFTKRVVKILLELGKTPMVWGEALTAGLDRSVIVQTWRGSATLRAAVRRGHRTVSSSGYYLDHMLSSAEHYDVDPQAQLEGAAAPAGPDDSLVLGGEACLWTELISQANAESRLWPRTAAVAERLWSQRDVTSTPDLYRRLEALEHQLTVLGSRHRSYQTAMLEHLTGGRDTAALRVLVEAVEPVRYYARHGSRRYTTTTPLDRLVDAASPESRLARELDALVSETSQSARLRELLKSWIQQARELEPLFEQEETSLLSEVEPLSRRLSELGQLGVEALDLIASERRPSAAWLATGRQKIAASRRPHAELVLAVGPAIERLLEAAAVATNGRSSTQ